MRLGVTRTESQLETLKERAAQVGIEIISLPVIETVSLPFEWPKDLAPEELDWLLFTSAKGVHSFFNCIQQTSVKLSNRTRIGTVGAKTGAAVTEYGRKVDFIPSDSYGEIFFTEWVDSAAKEGDTVLFARAEIVNFDPAPVMEKLKAHYFPLVCYQTLPRTIKSELIEDFSNDDYILFTAPSCVDSYQQQFNKPVAKPIAIGRSTAYAMNRLGWYGFITMKHAEVDNILEYLK